MMIRNANRNISVAVGHGYTLQKVKFAVNFVQKSGRNTTINDWVAAYNYIKDANETAQGCQACKAAKFTAAVRNYARYGYMTLLNEGYSPSDFEDKPVKVDEISKVDATEPEVVSTVQADDESQAGEEPQEENLEQEVEQLVSSIDGIVDGAASQSDVQRDVESITEAEVVSEPTVELPVEAKPKRVKKSKKNDKSDNK